MKKILAVLLCVGLILCLASCGDSEKDPAQQETTTQRTKVTTIEAVKADATMGKITEVSIMLGASTDDILNKYEPLPDEPDTTESEEQESTTYEEHNHDTVYAEVHEGRDLTLYQCGKEQYFFVNDDVDEGVAVIACVGDAYKFQSGYHTSDDVEFALGKAEAKDIPAGDELFFLPGVPENVTRLTYNFENIRLDFIFVDNYLMSTVLTDTDVYSEFGDSAEENTTEQGEE